MLGSPAQVKPGSTAQVALQPSPSAVLPSSQASAPPMIAVAADRRADAGRAGADEAGLDRAVACSRRRGGVAVVAGLGAGVMPSPQIDVQTLGPPRAGEARLDLAGGVQPSPLVVLPSSQASVPAMMPSPQTSCRCWARRRRCSRARRCSVVAAVAGDRCCRRRSASAPATMPSPQVVDAALGCAGAGKPGSTRAGRRRSRRRSRVAVVAAPRSPATMPSPQSWCRRSGSPCRRSRARRCRASSQPSLVSSVAVVAGLVAGDDAVAAGGRADAGRRRCR